MISLFAHIENYFDSTTKYMIYILTKTINIYNNKTMIIYTSITSIRTMYKKLVPAYSGVLKMLYGGGEGVNYFKEKWGILLRFFFDMYNIWCVSPQKLSEEIVFLIIQGGGVEGLYSLVFPAGQWENDQNILTNLKKVY